MFEFTVMSVCTALLNWSSEYKGVQMLASACALHLPTILCPGISDTEYGSQESEVNPDRAQFKRDECRAQSKLEGFWNMEVLRVMT